MKSESEINLSRPSLCDPCSVAHQVPLSMGFSRQEYRSGLPIPPPRDLPNPGTEPRSPALLLPWATREALEFKIPVYKSLCLEYSHFSFWLSWWLSGKEPTCQCRWCRFNPWVRKIPGEGNGNPLQYSYLGNPMDRGVWWARVHGVEKSWTQLSDLKQ